MKARIKETPPPSRLIWKQEFSEVPLIPAARMRVRWDINERLVQPSSLADASQVLSFQAATQATASEHNGRPQRIVPAAGFDEPRSITPHIEVGERVLLVTYYVTKGWRTGAISMRAGRDGWSRRSAWVRRGS